MAISFDTGAPKYAWLNKHFVPLPKGACCSKEQLEYRIYRVT